MSPQKTEDSLRQVLPPWQETKDTQHLDNVPSYQSLDIADLTEHGETPEAIH